MPYAVIYHALILQMPAFWREQSNRLTDKASFFAYQYAAIVPIGFGGQIGFCQRCQQAVVTDQVVWQADIGRFHPCQKLSVQSIKVSKQPPVSPHCLLILCHLTSVQREARSRIGMWISVERIGQTFNRP